MGLGTVEIGNIDINLFRGRVLLEEVGLYKSAARVFYLQRGEIDLSILSLLEQRLHLQSLSLSGVSLTVQQESEQPLHVAGVALPTAVTNDTQPVPAAAQTSSWSFGIDEMHIRRGTLLILHPQFSETVQLEAISLGALSMWRPEYVTPLNIRIALREGIINVAAKSSPFSDKPSHHVELDIAALPLASFAQLAKPVLAELDGALSTQMTFQLQQGAAQTVSLNQQGNLSLTDLRLRSDDSVLTQQGLHWNGSLELGDVADMESLQVTGELKLTGVGLRPLNRKNPVISLRELALSGVQLLGSKELVLADVTVDSLVAEAVRSHDSVSLVGLPASPAVGVEKEPAEVIEQPITAVDSTPFKLRIGQVVLRGENRFTFDDRAVKPPFRHTLAITEGKFEHIDTSLPEQATTVMLKGKDDFYTQFSVAGEVKPFASQLSLNLKTKLNNFDMPPTSSYLVQLLGYRITTGQLDSDVAMQIESNQMQGEIELRMNQLKLEPEDPERIEAFKGKTTLPLNTALSLLRDSDDNIKLKLPISGKLDDPQFDINDIINTALGNSLKAASVSYLKLLLQPYGSLITVLQMAGKAAGHIQLDPVKFAAGSAKLNNDVAPYLEKISKLLEKKGINMQLCGFSTTEDLNALTKGKEKTVPPAGHPALEALAKQRAEGIKSLLVNNYGVLPEQLFVCHPELDPKESATARVELSI